MSIVVTTPTGKIGSKTVKRLIEAGADVSVIVRDGNKLDASVKGKVKILEGSLLDLKFVTKAFQGAKTVFWVTPNDWSNPDLFNHDSELADVVAKAVRENKVPHVLNLSSEGANLDKAGPISALRIVELRLNDVAENVLHLRPGFFFENFFTYVDMIKNASAVFNVMSGDAKFPMIATQDIADVAAKLLLESNWKGIYNRGLHGPENLSMNQALKILSESIGKSVNYVQVPPVQVLQAFIGIGAPPAIAQAYVDMELAIDGLETKIEPRSAETTTPTKFKDWCDMNLRPLF